MGRGGGNRFKSRRGGRGGGRGGNQGRFGSVSMSKKDVSHFRQFGEKHPSEEFSRDFGAPASKKGKFDRGRRGGSSGFTGRFPPGSSSKPAETDSSGSSDGEEETTPYNELLSVFTGKKPNAPVQIISEDEEDSEDEEEEAGSSSSEDDELLSEVNNAGVDQRLNDLEVLNDDKEQKQSLSLKEAQLVEEAEGERNSDESEVEDKLEDCQDTVEEEDTVIEDAEIDPELNDADESRTIDPFLEHYERDMSDSLRNEMKKDKPAWETQSYDWNVIERFTYTGLHNLEVDVKTKDFPQSSVNLSELDKFPPVLIPRAPASPVVSPTLESLHIKSQLSETIPIANQVSIDRESCSHPLTPLQCELIDLASRYHDMYFPLQTVKNAEEIRTAYCIHVANHVLKTRTRIVHHNAKMASKSEVPEAFRDQGFVRPKVLILAPFKDSALRIVKTLLSLILKEEKGNVANSKRFLDEYGGQTLFMPKTNPKPEDYMSTFAGNVEDNFKIGMAVTKKSVKLYTGFYSSDIIVASPLGLRMIVGAEGEKDRDYDFLSSIEVLILDQSDIFIMQNWDHVLHIMRHLHLQPVTSHGTDFARIRPWALDGLSKYYCQTLIFSSVACPEHSSLLSKYCKNYAGQVKVVPVNLKGSICHVTGQIPQVFQNFKATSIHEADDERFKYFTKHVLPNFKDKLMSHTMIFVSSYFDFVRIRNYLKREEGSFVQICEYSKDKKIARARDLFFHGSNHFLLYTERSHFFRRFRLKGIGHIVFYQLPQNPQFYPELCNLIRESFQNRRVRQRKNSSVNVIYCQYDAPRLAAIVGSERAGHMLSSDKQIHAFVSGDI